MRHILYIIIFFFITNCTLNKVINHHGVHFLDKKHTQLTINSSNKNDIIALLGPPSTKSTFDNDLWIYIERATGSSRVSRLGKVRLLKNNVLILEIDSNGLLAQKIFVNKDSMNKLEFSEDFTQMKYTKKSFIYDFLSSVRQKINHPLGKRGK